MAEPIELRVASDLESKIAEFSKIVEAKDVDLNDKANKANKVISLWNDLHKCLEDKDCTEDFPSLFDKLYLFTVHLILKGSWHDAITTCEKKDVYKNGLIEALDGIIQDAITYPDKIELCRNLKPLIDTSPWGLSYITDIFSKDLTKSAPTVDELWEQENPVLLTVRVEILCSLKDHQHQLKAFALAQACYLKGYSIHDDPKRQPVSNENIQHNAYTKELYLQFRDIFYLLLCRLNNTSKFHELPTPFIPTALEVVERLKSDVGRIAPKWKEWKKAHKTIIMAIVTFLTNQNQLEVDADSLKTLFSHWIRCTSKLDEGEEFRPVKEMISKIDSIKTDYAYELANAILENFSSHADSGPKFVQLYIRALSKDNNQFESLGVNEKSNSEVVKNFKLKLAQRYLRMAAAFTSDKEMNFEMTLTAFSLSPSEMLFERLFENGCNREIVNETHKPIELTQEVSDDLQTVTRGCCRWSSLIAVKDKSELKQLCRQHLDTGGRLKVQALDHLHPDYSNYEPQKDEQDKLEDFGYEPGYEPPSLMKELSEANKIKRPRGRPRKDSLPTDSSLDKNLKQRNIQDNYSLNGTRNVRKSHHKTIKKVGRPRTKTKKSRLVLGSKLMKVINEENGVGASSSFVNPSLPLIYSTEHYSGMRDKDFCAPGETDRTWNSIINPYNFVSSEEDISFDSLKHKLIKGTPVEKDFLSSLTDSSYNSLKIHFHLQEQNVQPEVGLPQEIPPKFVNNVAEAQALEKVLQFVQEPLSVLDYALENPTCSSTLSQSLEQQVSEDDQLKPSSINTSQILQEAYNFLSVQNFQPTSSSPSSQSSKSNVIPLEPGSKTKESLFRQVQENIENTIHLKSQALGLENTNMEVLQEVASHLLPSSSCQLSSLISNNSQIDSITSVQESDEAALPEHVKEPLWMDTIMKSLVEDKFEKLRFKSGNTLVPAHSLPSENLTSNSDCLERLEVTEDFREEIQLVSLLLEGLNGSPGDTNDNMGSATNIHVESAIQSYSILDRRSDAKYIQQDEDLDVDNQFIEVTNGIHGGLLNGDLSNSDTSESREVYDDAPSVTDSAQINPDKDLTTTVTINTREFKQVQETSLHDDSRGRELRRKRKVKHYYTPSPSPPRPESIVLLRKSTRISRTRHPNNNNNNEGVPLPKLRKSSRILKEPLENHALYDEEVICLNDQNGFIEPKSSEQNFLSDKWKKDLPSENKYPEVVNDNRINLSECTCSQLISICNPNKNNSLCKVHSKIKDVKVSLTRLSPAKTNGHIASVQQNDGKLVENGDARTSEADMIESLDNNTLQLNLPAEDSTTTSVTLHDSSKENESLSTENDSPGGGITILEQTDEEVTCDLESETIITKSTYSELVKDCVTFILVNNGDDCKLSDAGEAESPYDDYAIQLDEAPLSVEDSTPGMTLQDSSKEDESLSTENDSPGEGITILEQTDEEVTSLYDLESETITTKSTCSEEVEGQVTFILVKNGDVNETESPYVDALREGSRNIVKAPRTLMMRRKRKGNKSKSSENNSPRKMFPNLKRRHEDVTSMYDSESEWNSPRKRMAIDYSESTWDPFFCEELLVMMPIPPQILMSNYSDYDMSDLRYDEVQELPLICPDDGLDEPSG